MAWDLLKLHKGNICLSQRGSRICQATIHSGQRLREIYAIRGRWKGAGWI